MVRPQGPRAPGEPARHLGHPRGRRPRRGRRLVGGLTPASARRRLLVAGCALNLAGGWNVADLGAIADTLTGAYGLTLAGVGLLTTALFLTHSLVQLPGGRMIDRLGARPGGLVAIALLVVTNALALVAAEPAPALVLRALMGVGTGLTFVAGAELIRGGVGASTFWQGLFGALGIGAAGLSLVTVPLAEHALGWRAPYALALALAAGAGATVLRAPARPERRRAARPPLSGVLRAGALWRLAAIHGASFGLSVVVGNWVVTYLLRGPVDGRGAAAAIGAATLALGVPGRLLGGWLVRAKSAWTAPFLRASLLAGGAAVVVLAVEPPLVLTVAAAVAIGVLAGLPFGAVLVAAGRAVPAAPGAGVGLVNCLAGLVVVVGTPLVGLGFQAPGGDRLAFLVIGVAWCAASAAVTASDLDARVAPVRPTDPAAA